MAFSLALKEAMKFEKYEFYAFYTKQFNFSLVCAFS
jgi:hypothetical protein